jgi:ribose 5-phosphate isomerase
VRSHIRQVDLLVGVLVRLGSHDGYLDASNEADAGSVMTKGGGAVRVAEKPSDDFMGVVFGV